MVDCPKHDKLIEEMAEIKQRITANEKDIKNGWVVIRQNERDIDELKQVAAETKEKTTSIFRMLKSLTETIKSIDDKLDIYMKDIRQEIKETEREISELKTKTAVATNNIEWNWKTILAFGSVITFLVGVIGNLFTGGV